MPKREENKKTGLSQFIRYREGKMTGKQRNSFERNLQKDVFAEEAQEGLEKISAEELSVDIAKLSARLEKRIHRNRRNLYYKVASSIAVLMIISSVFVIIQRNKTDVRFRQSEEGTIIEIRESKPVFKETIVSEDIETIVSKDVIKEKQLNKKESNREEKNEREELPEESNNSNADAVRAPSIQSLRKAERGFIAAENPVSERAVRSIPSALYEKSEEPDSIVSYFSPAQPVTGFDEYENYIRMNIQRPDSSGQRVVVVTSFKVHSDGTISEIRIIRSPGPEFSDEAIRLLRTGPAWKPAISNGVAIEDSITYRIIF